MNEYLKVVYQKIMIALAKRGKTQSWLAQEMNTTPQALSSVLVSLKNGESINTGSIDKIEKALNENFFITKLE